MRVPSGDRLAREYGPPLDRHRRRGAFAIHPHKGAQIERRPPRQIHERPGIRHRVVRHPAHRAELDPFGDEKRIAGEREPRQIERRRP